MAHQLHIVQYLQYILLCHYRRIIHPSVVCGIEHLPVPSVRLRHDGVHSAWSTYDFEQPYLNDDNL